MYLTIFRTNTTIPAAATAHLQPCLLFSKDYSAHTVKRYEAVRLPCYKTQSQPLGLTRSANRYRLPHRIAPTATTQNDLHLGFRRFSDTNPSLSLQRLCRLNRPKLYPESFTGPKISLSVFQRNLSPINLTNEVRLYLNLPHIFTIIIQHHKRKQPS